MRGKIVLGDPFLNRLLSDSSAKSLRQSLRVRSLPDEALCIGLGSIAKLELCATYRSNIECGVVSPTDCFDRCQILEDALKTALRLKFLLQYSPVREFKEKGKP
jgi:hypothetical protein